MPVQENDINIKSWYEDFGVVKTIKRLDPFVIRNPKTVEEKLFFVAHFDQERLEEFVGHEDPATFFSPAERSRIVFFLMEKTKYGTNNLDVGIFNMQHKGILADVYPLHDFRVSTRLPNDGELTVFDTKYPCLMSGSAEEWLRLAGLLAEHASRYGRTPDTPEWSESVGLKTLSNEIDTCLLYTSPSPRDLSTSRMPSSA